MSRRDDAPSVKIINHVKYIVEKRNLLCEVNISNPRVFMDLYSKTKRLYCPKGKAFLLETISDMTERILCTEVLSEKDARAFMNKHPEGIKEDVYKRYFGEPEEP